MCRLIGSRRQVTDGRRESKLQSQTDKHRPAGRERERERERTNRGTNKTHEGGLAETQPDQNTLISVNHEGEEGRSSQVQQLISKTYEDINI